MKCLAICKAVCNRPVCGDTCDYIKNGCCLECLYLYGKEKLPCPHIVDEKTKGLLFKYSLMKIKLKKEGYISDKM